MPWNGSGTYAPPPASFPEVTGTTIDAARFNATVNDLASGITAALAKNGENAATANLPMGGFKHTGAGDGTSTGEYVTWNQTGGVRFPGISVGIPRSSWAGSGVYAIDIGSYGGFSSDGTGVNVSANTYYDGTNYRAKGTQAGALMNIADGVIAWYTIASVSAGAVQTLVERMRLNASGHVGVGADPTTNGRFYTYISDGSVPAMTARQDGAGDVARWLAGPSIVARITGAGDFVPTLNTAAPPLASNLQMVFTLTSNTNLRISVRGSDGTTRIANITLA